MPRKDIHPKYYENALFVCSTCDSQFIAGSTKSEEIRMDVCSHCHAFYTGNQQFSNTAGRVEQFKNKFNKQTEVKAAAEQASQQQKELNAKTNKPKKDNEKKKLEI